MEKSPRWRLEKVPKLTLKTSFWEQHLRLGLVCSASKLWYGWTALPAVLHLGLKWVQEQSSTRPHVHRSSLDKFDKDSHIQTCTHGRKLPEALWNFKDCKESTLIQVTENLDTLEIAIGEFQAHKNYEAVLTEGVKLIQYIK